MATQTVQIPEGVDLEKRYDIYYSETNSRIVVYRGAFFRGARTLAKTREFDMGADFIEIEQANGQGMFVRRHSIVRFCEAGGKDTSEQAWSKPD